MTFNSHQINEQIMAQFQNGHPKFGGRTKGTPNKKTKFWHELGDWLLEEGAEKAKQELLKLNGHLYLRYYGMFAEYFKPKLSRIENRDLTQVEELLDLSPEERIEKIRALRKQMENGK